jgi:hypothetical protein
VTRPEDQLRRAMELNDVGNSPHLPLGAVERITTDELESAVIRGLYAFGADDEADYRLEQVVEARRLAQER